MVTRMVSAFAASIAAASLRRKDAPEPPGRDQAKTNSPLSMSRPPA
jgi:hypothetical protein